MIKNASLPFLLLFVLILTNDNLAANQQKLRAKVYLAGSYQSGGTMTTNLQVSNLLPTNQPFNQAPWNYSGNETASSVPANATDWLLVEVLEVANMSCVVERVAAFVRNDGQLIDTNGTLGLNLSNVTNGVNYLLIIRSRNHLAIASANALTFPQTNAYDFTQSNQVLGGNAQVSQTIDGNYAMISGDCNSDGLITVNDFNVYINEFSAINQYYDSDLNLDGNTTVSDFNLYVLNSSRIGVLLVRNTNLPMCNTNPPPSSMPMATEWFSSINGSQPESHGHYIMSCSDGGYLQVGETGFIPNSAKMLVVKTDANGNLLWQKEFGTLGHNLGNSALEVSDGYLICGALNENSTLIKLNKTDGSTIFQQTYNNGGSDAIEHIAQIPTGLVAVGYVQALDNLNTFYTEGQGYMQFLDNAGNQTASQNLSTYTSHAYRIKVYNNELIISGLSNGAEDYNLIKMDFSGNIIWNKILGDNSDDHCFGLDINNCGEIFLTGHTISGTPNWDTYTMKLDNNGNLLWQQKRGNPRGFDPQYIHDEAWGIKATADGGCLVIAGTGDEYMSYSDCNTNGCSDIWRAYLLKFDSAGNLQWETTYIGANSGLDWAGEDIDLTSDGGAIIGVDDGQFGFLKVK